MDPLTAVGLASNVVQFVDFAGKVISESVRIYRARGRKDEQSEHHSLEDLTESLQEHNAALQDSLAGQARRPGQLSQTDRELMRLCEECHSMSARLLNALGRLRNSRVTIWTSFADALKTVWSEGDIMKMRQTLDSYRQQIALYLLVSVRDEIKHLKNTQTDRSHEVLLSVQDMRLVVEGFFEKIARQDLWEEDLSQAIHADYERRPSKATTSSSPAIGMQRELTDEDTENFNQGLLNWLQFTELDHRSEKISTAYARTFEWIFRPAPSGVWSDYIRWLVGSDDPLYWITGKAAAGKSTLMKFIFNDKRTIQHLEDWAGGKRLIISAFYFWNSGTPIQMSEEGMARTLLYETIRQAPELWSVVFPQKMEEYIVCGKPWRKPPTWTEIMKAFRLLVDGAGEYKLFFFVDGLDEFGADHEKLIDLINSLLSPHVKTCVSSRPWNVFQDGFQQRPKLRLEDLTFQDIKHFVTSRFSKNIGFRERRLEDEASANQLIENITRKASGVFLWVTLVTDSLLEGLSDGERLDQLQTRLDALPTDLETLFWKVLTRLGDRHLERTSELLQILRASLETLNLLDLSYADEPDPEFALNFQIGPISARKANARAEIIARRLNACCKGLIESKPAPGHPLADATVGYLHRTVKDYVERPEVWQKFIEMSNKGFNPYIRLCNSVIVRLKISDFAIFGNHFSGIPFWNLVKRSLHYAVKADPQCTSGLQPRFIDEIDKTATHLSTVLRYDGDGHNFVERFAAAFGLPVTHWSGTRSTSYLNTSMFHLAIQSDLEGYVEDCLKRQGTSRLSELTLARGLAVVMLQQPEDLAGIGIREREGIYVQLLLKHGVDPNLKIDDIMLHENQKSGAFSPWEVLLERDKAHYPHLAPYFLEHGADPRVVTRKHGFSLYRRAQKKKLVGVKGWRNSVVSIFQVKSSD